jgi:hypothetical protein
MSTRRTFAFAAAASLLLAGSAGLNAKPVPAPQRPVMSVRAASVYVIATPHTVRICARGLVPTGGWTNPQLRPVIYIQAPPNGIYDFDFVATPPSGIVPQVVLPIKAMRLWQPYPVKLKGVRVKSAGNSIVALLNHGPSAC